MILQMLISLDQNNSSLKTHQCFGPSKHYKRHCSLVLYWSQSMWLHSTLMIAVSCRCLTILMVWLITQVVDKTCREGFHLLWCRSHSLNYMSVMHCHLMTLSNFFGSREWWSMSEGLCHHSIWLSIQLKDYLTQHLCCFVTCCHSSTVLMTH